MTFSLYDATIPSNIQIATSVSTLLDKAIEFCAEKNGNEQDIIQTTLIEDMLPFAYQVSSVSHHSIGAIEGIRQGIFSPNMNPPPDNFTALKQLTDASIKSLSELDPTEVNGFIGQDMRFEMGEFALDFTAENFLLSFSQPNFYFHATTAYDILRMKGVNIGKREFIGAIRIKK
jgi:hypothetical protein